MTEEEAIENLRKYIDEDVIYKNKKAESDFDEYCINHCRDIETILNLIQLKQRQIDLDNEAEIALNNKIIDLEIVIEKLRNNNKRLLKKLRNRVKEVKKLTKYSLYKKEFSRLNKEIEKYKYLYEKALADLVKVEGSNAK